MILRCVVCGRNIESIGQVNMSYELNSPLCENCARTKGYFDIQDEFDCCNHLNDQLSADTKKYLTRKQFKFLMRYAGWSYFKTKMIRYDLAIKKISQIVYMMRQKGKKQ